MQKPIVRFENVTMRFGEMSAVKNASLDIYPGQVLAVLGENGAGKSTLMKMLYGIHTPSEGTIELNGQPSPIMGPGDAMINGVGMVFQHFSQLPAMTVRDNLLLAWPKTPFWTGKRNSQTADVLSTLKRMAPTVHPDRLISNLEIGEQQLVELCKVLNIAAKVVILDEPTSVLTPEEARKLHGFVRKMADEGVAVVLITHKLGDVQACADHIAVMRRGEVVNVFAAGEKPMAEVVTIMMGSELNRDLQKPAQPKKHVDRLVLDQLCASGSGMFLNEINLRIGAGEVLGVAGVAGNGQALLAEAVAGVHPIKSGLVLLDGIDIARHDPLLPVFTPLGYIPEQPRDNAIIDTMNLSKNLRLRELAADESLDDITNLQDLLEHFNVNPPDLERLAGTLSGGNIQKLVAARELGSVRKAILACYPTMGLDLAAVEMIYHEIFTQAEAGAAVLWISEDLDDLLAAAHRIAVLREGKIVTILDNDGTLTRDEIGAHMTGMHSSEHQKTRETM